MQYGKRKSSIVNKSGFEISVEFDVPQVTSVQDAIALCGSEAELLSRVNNHLSHTAVAMSRHRLAQTTGTSLTQLHSDIEEAKALAKYYNPMTVARTVKAAKAETVNRLIRNIRKIKTLTYSPDAILRYLFYPELDTQDWEIIDEIMEYWEKHVKWS